MDTRGLRYFQAVAEFGSYSRGAEFLRISQPAVSRQIRALEDELGRPLFIRHSHGVNLTDAGRMLLERSQVILRQFDQARDDIRSGVSGPSGTVTLAVPPAAGNFLVPALTKRFSAEYPNVFLKVVAGFSGYIHEWLVRGQVDLACLHDPVPQPGFTVVPLVKEEVFLVGSPGAFATDRDHVRTQDLAGLPLILPGRPNASRRLLDGWLSRRGIRLNVKLEADDHLVIRALMKEGVGFSLLSQGAFLTDLRHGELQAWPFRPRAYWNLALVTMLDERRTEIARVLADMIRETVRHQVRSRAWPGVLLDP
jgi:LysR family transcriptional regulator, nitrogen assimilation regulatory protein